MPDTETAPPFSAYTGVDPYVFVSYSHKDATIVFPEIAKLRGEGWRIWYDEGIDPGNEWPEEVAKALAGAAFFVVFVSPNAVESHNVRNEINFAIARKKPFLAVHITETSLPAGLELQMGSVQAVMRFRMTEESCRRKLCAVLSPTLRMSAEEAAQQEEIDSDKRQRRPADSPPISKMPFLPRGVWQITVGWACAWIVGSLFRVHVVRYGLSWYFTPNIGFDFGGTSGGFVGGIVTALSINRYGRKLSPRQMMLVTVAWVVSWWVEFAATELLAVGLLIPLGAFVTLAIARQAGSRIPVSHMVWIVGLWIVGLAVGITVAATMADAGLTSPFGQYVSWGIGGAIMGLVGGLPTLVSTRHR